MATTRLNLKQVMTDQAVDTALTMTAQMFGLPKETVATIVRVGLPLMAELAEVNPELFNRMYVATLAMMPEPIQDFYARMAGNQAVRQSVMDDYQAMYGSMLNTVNREAARQAGTTDGQARDVLAATLPAISQVFAEANTAGTQERFAHDLRAIHA